MSQDRALAKQRWERRRVKRYKKHLPVTVRLDFCREFEAACLNLSRLGVYCVADTKVQPGKEVDVLFGQGLCLTGNIVRVEKVDDDIFGFAVQQSEPSEDQDILNLEGFSIQLALINKHAFSYYGRLHRVLEHIQEMGTEGLTLSDAADLANLETTYFSHFFRTKVGVTFSRWIQYLRIAKSLEILRTANCSITEVAFQSGFNDLSAFHKAFKKWTGLTPGELKSLVRPA